MVCIGLRGGLEPRMHSLYSAVVSMGSMGSMEPINFEKRVLEPINFSEAISRNSIF